MENFISLAKEGYEKYQESQGGGQSEQYSKTGGAEYNTPSNSNGRQGSGEVNIDHEEVVQTASQHGSGDSSLFSEAMSFVSSNKQQHTEPVDEEAATNAHQQAYSEGGASNMHASSMGSAAALQVLKQFTGGGSSGGSQSQLISMAMAEASQLFESSGGGSGGSKQEAVNGAAMTVMKLLVQSKFSSMTGGSNSGGLSSMMGLASKFM